MNFRPLILCVLAFALIWHSKVSAAVSVIDKDASPLELSMSAVYVDDINPTIEGALGAYGAVVAPKGKLVKNFEGAQILLDYSAQLARYKLEEKVPSLDSTQDFNNYKIKLLSRFYLGQAWFVDAYFEHFDETQRFGEGISQLREGVFEADRLKQNKGGASLVYGNDTSSRFISLSAYSNTMTYQPINDYSSFFDIVEQKVEFNIAFKQSELSSLLFRVAMADEDFVADEREDSQVYQGLLGMSWKPSGKTKLEALVGAFSREFESLDSSTGLSWALDFSTQPTLDWLIEIKSDRFSGVSKSDFTSSSVEQNVSFKVTYQASERWHLGINLSAEKVEFEEVDYTSELDETHAEINLALHLKAHSKITFSVGANDQSYDNGLIEYQQREARLMWHVSL